MSDQQPGQQCSNEQHNDVHYRDAMKRPLVKRGLTFWCFCGTLGVVSTLFVAMAFDAIPWWLNWILAAPLYHFLVICGHDAIHRGAHKSRKLNDAVGWLTAQMFCVPYPLVRCAHLSHHASEGAPDDIEQFAYRPGITLPLRIIFGNWMYYLFLSRCRRRVWALAAGTAIVTIVLFVIWPREALLGWFSPMQTGVSFIMITTIWIPHGHNSRWWMDNYPVITGYHEDHHAQPGYPFHQISKAKVRAYARASGRKVLAAGRRNRAKSHF